MFNLFRQDVKSLTVRFAYLKKSKRFSNSTNGTENSQFPSVSYLTKCTLSILSSTIVHCRALPEKSSSSQNSFDLYR